MKTSTLSSILLMGALTVTGWQVDFVEAGGARFGFQSSFSGNTGFQGRVGSGKAGFQSNLQRRIRGQHGFHHNSRGSVNRRSGVSPLRQRLDAHTRKMQKDLFDDRSGLQDRSDLQDRAGRDDRAGRENDTRFGKRHPDFDLERKGRGRSGNNNFKGRRFDHPRHGRFGMQPRGRVPGPVLFSDPFRRFVLPPGFGVFQPFGVTTNVTAFPGRSDFSQRILDKTQGIAFKNNFRDQNAWKHLDAEAFGGRDDVRNKQSPPRSHHYLKRMKDGKKVFSDYGGRVVGHGKSGPQSPPSPFSLR